MSSTDWHPATAFRFEQWSWTCIGLLPLLLPLDLSDLRHEKADLVAIEFGDRRNAVDVLDEVFGCAQERFERSLAFTATEQVAVRRDDHLDQPGRGPGFTEQATEDRLEVVADLDRPELLGAVLPNLVGITDGEVVGHLILPTASWFMSSP